MVRNEDAFTQQKESGLVFSHFKNQKKVSPDTFRENMVGKVYTEKYLFLTNFFMGSHFPVGFSVGKLKVGKRLTCLYESW